MPLLSDILPCHPRRKSSSAPVIPSQRWSSPQMGSWIFGSSASVTASIMGRAAQAPPPSSPGLVLSLTTQQKFIVSAAEARGDAGCDCSLPSSVCSYLHTHNSGMRLCSHASLCVLMCSYPSYLWYAHMFTPLITRVCSCVHTPPCLGVLLYSHSS